MKIVIKALLSICLVMVVGAMLTANAQIQSDASIRADITHSFVVNNTTLPAGKYIITVPDTSSDLNVLEIRSENDKVAVLFETEPANVTSVAHQTELVFDKIGDTYFLAQVFMSGDKGGNQLLKSKKQRRLEESGAVAERNSIAATPVQAKASKQTVRKPN